MMDLDEVGREGAISLSQAAAFIGEVTGRRPASTQVWRWAAKGLQTGARLEAFQMGSKWLTTRSAVRRFLQGVRPVGGEAVSRGGRAPAVASSPAIQRHADRFSVEARRRQIEDARARLSGMGLKFLLV
jgi:hypothetical protein